MSDVRSLIESAQERGLGFSLVEDRVQVRAPKELDGDTEALICELRRNKEKVKALLAGDDQLETDNRPEEPTEPKSEDDPILTPEQWFPVFRACVLRYHDEHPDHDRCWLKEHHPELYQRIVAQENLIDALGTVRLSKLMGHLREWRSLMLQAEFATAGDVRELFGGEVRIKEETARKEARQNDDQT